MQSYSAEFSSRPPPLHHRHMQRHSVSGRGLDDSTFMPKLVDAFNKSHKDQVELQIVPVNELVQKYAIAAAGGSAPDALSLDLIYTPSFAASGQLDDLTDFAKSLPYFSSLSKAHLSVGTYEDKIYGMPFSADGSVLIWNKDLFKKAGLDPEKGPTNWAEIRADAEKVNALGKDTYGFYFSGNCGGCNIFTFTPLVWASGGDIFADGGKKATLDTPQMHDAVAFYQGMVKDGLVPAGAQTDTGCQLLRSFRDRQDRHHPIRLVCHRCAQLAISRPALWRDLSAWQDRRLLVLCRR